MTESSDHKLPVAGPQHELLKPFAGTFRAVVKIWTQGPEPIVHQGTMVNSFQLNNLYLHQSYTGDPAPAPFPPFLGQGFWGYNFGENKYEGFWIDNMSSIMQLESGHVDSTGQVWTMFSEIRHPNTGAIIRRKSEIRLIDADHHQMTTWMTTAAGQEFRTMEIRYQRVS